MTKKTAHPPMIGTPLYETAYVKATTCPCPYKIKSMNEI